MRLGKTTTGVLAVALLACWGGHRALGGVIEFIDPLEWEAAVGAFTTIDFTGFTAGTFITDQYADLGILFTDGNDSIFFNPGSFPNDEWGLDGNGNISVAFDTPQGWIGVDFPGFLTIELYAAGQLIHTGAFGFGGVGNFGGLVSTQLFDAAVLVEGLPGFEAEIDDLHFGVPVPGALWLLAIGALLPLRGRRRERQPS